MPDKPGRRKKRHLPWEKIVGISVVVLLAIASGWYIYQNYIYKAPPIYARIDTSLGAIDIVLYPACAPQTVNNFVSLVNSGFYTNLVWHRIVPGFVIQAGDPYSRGGLNSTRSKWGTGGSNATVPLEVTACKWLGTYEGYIAMARLTSGYNTGTSQFFINLSNSTSNLSINGNYTVFGKVLSGWGVVQAIANKNNVCYSPLCPSAWQSDEPIKPVFINDIMILNTEPTSA
jgi:cyclophilin family peptidyl-prolyl cis-trans isomerase